MHFDCVSYVFDYVDFDVDYVVFLSINSRVGICALITYLIVCELICRYLRSPKFTRGAGIRSPDLGCGRKARKSHYFLEIVLCDAADTSAVGHTRQGMCAAQRTCLLCDTADKYAV